MYTNYDMGNLSKKVISSVDSPKALGPYSQGISVGNLVFVSGQLGIDAKTGKFIGTTVAEQTRQALTNIQFILKASGTDLSQAVKTTVFLKYMTDFQVMNEVYGTFFPENGPVRSTIAVAELPKKALVEIDCIAITNNL